MILVVIFLIMIIIENNEYLSDDAFVIIEIYFFPMEEVTLF